MTNLRRVLGQIGGNNALSLWSFIATIPLAILVSSTYEGTPSIGEVIVWQSIVLAVHAALGLIMYIAKRTIFDKGSLRALTRPALALAFFALLGTVRGLALEGAQNVVGISGAVFQERMAVNILGSVIALSVIAIVVDDFRHDQQIVHRLENARAAIANLRKEEDSLLRNADIAVLEQVHRQIEEELQHDSISGSQVREISEKIVRRVSHELHGDSNKLQVASYPLSKVKLTSREAFALIRAPHAFAVASLVELAIFPAVLFRFGALVALENAVIGGVLIYSGCWLINTIHLNSLSAPIRFFILFILLVCTGSFAATVASVFIPPLDAIYPERIIGISTSVAGVGIALALRRAIHDGRIRRQENLSEALASEAKLFESMNNQIQERRRSAASFLHGTIQSELIAKSLSGETAAKIRAVISQHFSNYANPPASDARSKLEDLVNAWSAVLDIELHVDDGVRQKLSNDYRRSEMLLDIVSEGLTNAVRHSSGKKITIVLMMNDGVIVARVTSHGALVMRPEPGIGLKQLADHGIEVHLESHDNQTTLTARF